MRLQFRCRSTPSAIKLLATETWGQNVVLKEHETPARVRLRARVDQAEVEYQVRRLIHPIEVRPIKPSIAAPGAGIGLNSVP